MVMSSEYECCERDLTFLAQYEALIEGEYRPVIRYAGRHGRPHCDVLDWNGQTIDKIWAPAGTTNNQAFTQAIRDIRENWKQHRNAFQERRRWM